MNNREWEKFYGGPLDMFGERIYVTINHKGQIYFNRHVYHLLGSPEYVNLYFSRRRDAIGIVPVTTKTPESFPLKVKQVGFVILASPFCRNFNIRVSGTQQFVRPDIDDHKLKLDLTRTVRTEVGLRRPRGQKRQMTTSAT